MKVSVQYSTMIVKDMEKSVEFTGTSLDSGKAITLILPTEDP